MPSRFFMKVAPSSENWVRVGIGAQTEIPTLGLQQGDHRHLRMRSPKDVARRSFNTEVFNSGSTSPMQRSTSRSESRIEGVSGFPNERHLWRLLNRLIGASHPSRSTLASDI